MQRYRDRSIFLFETKIWTILKYLYHSLRRICRDYRTEKLSIGLFLPMADRMWMRIYTKNNYFLTLFIYVYFWITSWWIESREAVPDEVAYSTEFLYQKMDSWQTEKCRAQMIRFTYFTSLIFFYEKQKNKQTKWTTHFYSRHYIFRFSLHSVLFCRSLDIQLYPSRSANSLLSSCL